MDAVEFVETLQRKIKNENRDEIIIRTTDDANLFVDLVEQWSKDHPRKTRQSVFLEQWPESAIDSYGVLDLCPTQISKSHRNIYGSCPHVGVNCYDCRREFWMKEVDE